MKFIFTILIIAMLGAQCASLESISLTQIPTKRKEEVSASSHKWIIFFFSFDNDYADEVTRKLKMQCPNGQIKGILTKDENFNYFISLVMKRQITAKGYCLKGDA